VGFRGRIFLGSALVVAALAVVTGAGVLATGRARLRRAIEADFAEAPALLRGRLSHHFELFKWELAAWAEDKRYASWLGRASAADTLDGKVAQADLKAAHDGLGALALASWDEFRVTNDRGTLLLDQRHQDAFGEDLTADEGVKRALDSAEVLRIRGHELEMIEAVSVEGNVRGVMMAGVSLEPLRDDLERILRAQVTFEPGVFPDQAPQLVDRGGESWLRALVAVPGLHGEPIGHVVLDRSLSRELAPFVNDLAISVALATAFGLVVALALSLLLARSLAAPVTALADATREIGRGNYAHRVHLRRSDELGQLAGAFNQMAEGLAQRIFFESALRRYLAQPVVEQLIADPTRLRLGGEKREVTVMFFDVAGFTTLAEQMAPEELVALCNAYLDALIDAIFQNGGTFDKFIGDAVMAFWGAPIAQPDHADRACRAALDMQAALRRFTSAHADPRVRDLTGRIGLNTGDAVLGNLGSSRVMNYTAMGDTVNVASRLEGVNKLYGTAILVAETTLHGARPETRAREIDTVRVVGRSHALKLYELLDDSSPSESALAAYGEGLAHYYGRRFGDAERAFKRAQAEGDRGPAPVMAARAAELATHPPPEDWDGAQQLSRK
jgi:class 3 adenylate cyclase